MSPFWEKFFYIFTWVTQGSSYLVPRAYGILHRMHHAFSDTEKDPHSPHHTENLFTMMWKTKMIYGDLADYKMVTEERFTRDIPNWHSFDRFAESWPSRVGWGTLYVLFYMYFVPDGMWYLYLLLPIHFLMGPVHGAIVNWCGHKYGYSNFDNNDKSKNSLVFDLVMGGELFQNNHHKYPNSVKFAAKWYEFDPTYPVVRFLSAIKIIKMNPAAASINA